MSTGRSRGAMQTSLVLTPVMSPAPEVGVDMPSPLHGGFLASYEAEGRESVEAAGLVTDVTWGVPPLTIAPYTVTGVPGAEEAHFPGAEGDLVTAAKSAFEGEVSKNALLIPAIPAPDPEPTDFALRQIAAETEPEQDFGAGGGEGETALIPGAVPQGSATGTGKRQRPETHPLRETPGEPGPSRSGPAERLTKPSQIAANAGPEPAMHNAVVKSHEPRPMAQRTGEVTSQPEPTGAPEAQAPADVGTGQSDIVLLSTGHAAKPPTSADVPALEPSRYLEPGTTAGDVPLPDGPATPVADRESRRETAPADPPTAKRRNTPSVPGVWERAFHLHSLPATTQMTGPMPGTLATSIATIVQPVWASDKSPATHEAAPDPTGAAIPANTAARTAGPPFIFTTDRPVVAGSPPPWLADETAETANSLEEAASVAAPPGTLVPAPGPSGPVGTVASPFLMPVHQAAARIAAALSHSTDGVTDIALSPEELGQVRLRLKPDASNPDRMVVMITFERPETLDLFRRNVGDLAEALRAAGYAGADIGFGQEGGGAGGFDQGHRHGSAPDLNDPTPPQTQAPRLAAGVSLDVRL